MTSSVPVQAIDLGVVSDQGRVRPRNEDAYGFEVLRDEQGNPDGWIFVVADGVGGEFHGDIASGMAAWGVIEVYKGLNAQNPLMPPADKLGEAIQFTNADIYNKAAELNVAGRMGTTVVVAVLRPDGVLSVAWVGDSRLYVISRRLGRIRQVSQDHTEVAEQVRQKLISQDQAVNHPRRNVLSRSVGGQSETTPDFAEGLLEHGDTIVICSDGLTRHLSPDHIKTLVLQSSPSEYVAQQLVRTANELGGKDNITALVVHVGARESQMDTKPPLDSEESSAPDSHFSMKTDYESTPRLPAVTPKKRERGIPVLGGIMVGILVILLVLVGVMFFSQQPPVALPTTNVADTNSNQATVSPDVTAAESVVTADVTDDPAQTPTAAPDRTQTAQAIVAVITQTSIAFNQNVTTTAQTVTSMEAISVTAEVTPTQDIIQALPMPGMQSPIETMLAVAGLSTPRATNAGPSAAETSEVSLTIPASESASELTQPLTEAALTARPTIEAVFAPLLEPYPTQICVATANEARAYSSVGGDSPYAVPANKVLYVDEIYPYKQNGETSNYYLARPNDSSQGAGWMKGEDLVPTRNLTPEQQAGLILLPATATVLTQETAQDWQPAQTLMITENETAFEINCLPMRVELTSLDAIYIVEIDTLVVALDTAPKSVNGAIWWNIRLPDGREGWVQQIYLDEVTTQQ